MATINVVVHGALGRMGQEVLRAVTNAEDMTPVTTEDRGKIQFSTEEMKVLYEALSFTDQLQTKDYERASEGVDLEALFQKVMKLANLN